VNDLNRRISELPSARQQLLRRLLEEEDQSGRAAPLARPAEDLDSYDAQLTYDPDTELDDVKTANRQFYDAVSRQLNGLEVGNHAYFLNFGYVSDGSPGHSRISLPTHYLNRNCIELVLELVGECDLTDRRVVDVGCGRGGTVFVLSRFFRPRTIVGVDLSPAAIDFCRTTHMYDGVRFYEGDAERLKFDDSSVDVVTNVESSHSYPNVEAFYAQVARVLTPGGHFLYTDLFPTARLRTQIEALTDLGFVLELERDITRNVLLSCSETARVHRNAFQVGAANPVVDNFLGMPGSQVYLEMQRGESTYRILRLRRPSA
jgi:phthiocerol/phenolphthiocerol synthesis type-I polyketide synthase E